MAFKIPAAGGTLKKNRFEFELEDETLSLPKVEYAPASADKFIRDRDQNMTNTEFILAFIESVDAEVGKKVRAAELARDQVSALQKAWLDASEVTPGE